MTAAMVRARRAGIGMLMVARSSARLGVATEVAPRGIAGVDVEAQLVARAGERRGVDVEAAPAVAIDDGGGELRAPVDQDAEFDGAVGALAGVVVVDAGVDHERGAERDLAEGHVGGARAVGGREDAAARLIVDLERAPLDAGAGAAEARADVAVAGRLGAGPVAHGLRD